MDQDIAIKVEHVSKIFEIPQENRDTLRERVLSFRKKMTYEIYNALDDVSFEIRRGEFFSIIGRNGSGKSTLLKILAGIYTPDKGSVSINGQISPFLELGVGFNPELSGKDNIYLNGTILGLTQNEIDNLYPVILEFSELERFIHLKVKNYSSGMQVRLAFSVAVHANKEILLMDEVLAVGDANFQVKCLNKFEEFISAGKTIVFVSHDPAAVQKYSDNVLYLESGKAAYIGRSDIALSKYMYTEVIREPVQEPSAQNENQVEPVQVMSDTSGSDSVETENDTQDGKSSVKDHQYFEISKVLIVNMKGEECADLIHGDPFSIHIHYNVMEDLEDLVFGITIWDQSKHVIFSTNTFAEKIDTGKIQKGDLALTFRIQNFLSSGKYHISARISDEKQKIFYSLEENVSVFRVSNAKRVVSLGGVDLPHEITISK